MRLTQIRQPTKRRHHVDKEKRGGTFIVPTPSTRDDDDDADDDDGRERERERERCRRVMMSQQPGKKEGSTWCKR